jgi:hypothetical protein
MAIHIIKAPTQPLAMAHDFSWLERLVLRRFHPRSLSIDTVGVMWFIYYLWNHEWKSALAIVIAGRVFAYLSVMRIDTEAFAETTLGRIALLHLQPVNLLVQFVGALVGIYGIWQRSTEIILLGVSLILLGHIFGWSRVDDRMANRLVSRK